jgi:hypothetical protein
MVPESSQTTRAQGLTMQIIASTVLGERCVPHSLYASCGHNVRPTIRSKCRKCAGHVLSVPPAPHLRRTYAAPTPHLGIRNSITRLQRPTPLTQHGYAHQRQQARSRVATRKLLWPCPRVQPAINAPCRLRVSLRAYYPPPPLILLPSHQPCRTTPRSKFTRS